MGVVLRRPLQTAGEKSGFGPNSGNDTAPAEVDYGSVVSPNIPSGAEGIGSSSSSLVWRRSSFSRRFFCFLSSFCLFSNLYDPPFRPKSSS